MNKHATQIVKHPLVTEKSTLMAKHNKVLFAVEKRANKSEIKRAVEELYKVKVVKVNTSVRRGKLKRVRFQPGYQSDQKRALVTLAPDSKIELV